MSAVYELLLGSPILGPLKLRAKVADKVCETRGGRLLKEKTSERKGYNVAAVLVALLLACRLRPGERQVRLYLALETLDGPSEETTA